jgi:hypothetical protein
LKDRSEANDELYDSIWEIVNKANAMSLHKNQLHRDYIMFAEADKPFIRTDKRTIKRRATLDLYADYIDRFYDSVSSPSRLRCEKSLSRCHRHSRISQMM